LWDELSPYGWVKLFLGTVEDEIICGNLVFSFGKTFRGKKWGWKQEMVRLRQQRIFRLLSLSEFNFRHDRVSGAKT
jgi:hypothetical protein